MASWGVKAASPRLSALVKAVGSKPGEEAEGDREEEGSEDDDSLEEEELLGDATPYGEETGSIQSREVLFEVKALSNFTAEEEDDLSFKEREILAVLESSRDDGWLLAENALGERGLVPSNYVQRLPLVEELSRGASPVANVSTTPRRGRDLWAKLKASVKQTSLAEILSALGAIPSGFRDSTLAKLQEDSMAYNISTWVFPKPSYTGMAFKDLRWDHVKNQLQPRVVKVSRAFSLVAARRIPLPGKGVQVISRSIRIAVFNKNDILSNIHSVKAVWSPQEPESWKVVPRSQTATNSAFHQRCVLRLDSTDANVELLFELGITFKREKTGETGELSCGWGTLPLFQHNGNSTLNKTYELKLHGGTPFESGVEVDPAKAINASGRRVPSILRTNKAPRLYVRLVASTRSQSASYCLLPAAIITSSLYVQAITCFRQTVAKAFLSNRLGLPLPSYVNMPSLNVFLKGLDQPDVMDSTLALFNEKLKVARRSEKQSLQLTAELLERVLLQHTLPLLHSPSLPPLVWSNEQKRLEFITEFNKKTTPLLAADSQHTAIDISEQLFSIAPR